jgi:hypothetical protein
MSNLPCAAWHSVGSGGSGVLGNFPGLGLRRRVRRMARYNHSPSEGLMTKRVPSRDSHGARLLQRSRADRRDKIDDTVVTGSDLGSRARELGLHFAIGEHPGGTEN